MQPISYKEPCQFLEEEWKRSKEREREGMGREIGLLNPKPPA
jgi:hypothetical protein